MLVLRVVQGLGLLLSLTVCSGLHCSSSSDPSGECAGAGDSRRVGLRRLVNIESPETSASAASSSQLLQAFLQPSVTLVYVVDDITLGSEWTHMPQAIRLSRNLTVRGVGDPRPIIDLAFRQKRVALDRDVQLVFQEVVLSNARFDLQAVAPGWDLFITGECCSRVILEDAFWYRLSCKPFSYLTRPSYLAGLQSSRPAAVPGNQTIVSREGRVCRRHPPPDAVGADAGTCPWQVNFALFDVAWTGMSVAADRKGTEPAGYYYILHNVTWACTIILTQECLDTYGPDSCHKRMEEEYHQKQAQLAAALQATQAPATGVAGPASASSHHRDRRLLLPVLLPCILGGAVLVIAAAAAFVWKRRQGKGGRGGPGLPGGESGGKQHPSASQRDSTEHWDGSGPSGALKGTGPHSAPAAHNDPYHVAANARNKNIVEGAFPLTPGAVVLDFPDCEAFQAPPPAAAATGQGDQQAGMAAASIAHVVAVHTGGCSGEPLSVSPCAGQVFSMHQALGAREHCMAYSHHHNYNKISNDDNDDNDGVDNDGQLLPLSYTPVVCGGIDRQGTPINNDGLDAVGNAVASDSAHDGPLGRPGAACPPALDDDDSATGSDFSVTSASGFEPSCTMINVANMQEEALWGSHSQKRLMNHPAMAAVAAAAAAGRQPWHSPAASGSNAKAPSNPDGCSEQQSGSVAAAAQASAAAATFTATTAAMQATVYTMTCPNTGPMARPACRVDLDLGRDVQLSLVDEATGLAPADHAQHIGGGGEDRGSGSGDGGPPLPPPAGGGRPQEACLGQGLMGRVVKGTLHGTTPVAVKLLHPYYCMGQQQRRQHLQQEQQQGQGVHGVHDGDGEMASVRQSQPSVPLSSSDCASGSASNSGSGNSTGMRDSQGAGPNSTDMQAMLRHEVDMLSRCCHRNIVRLLGAGLTPPTSATTTVPTQPPPPRLASNDKARDSDNLHLPQATASHHNQQQQRQEQQQEVNQEEADHQREGNQHDASSSRVLAAAAGPHQHQPFLVLELMQCSLSDLLYASDEPLSLERVLLIARDIAAGLAYLHPAVVHRDLKPSNVLLDASGTAKLADFGLSRLALNTLVTAHPEAGTAPYVAPELFDSRNYKISEKVDCYALGMVLWEMLTRTPPWEGLTPLQIAVNVALKRERPPLPLLVPHLIPSRCELSCAAATAAAGASSAHIDGAPSTLSGAQRNPSRLAAHNTGLGEGNMEGESSLQQAGAASGQRQERPYSSRLSHVSGSFIAHPKGEDPEGKSDGQSEWALPPQGLSAGPSAVLDGSRSKAVSGRMVCLAEGPAEGEEGIVEAAAALGLVEQGMVEQDHHNVQQQSRQRQQHGSGDSGDGNGGSGGGSGSGVGELSLQSPFAAPLAGSQQLWHHHCAAGGKHGQQARHSLALSLAPPQAPHTSLASHLSNASAAAASQNSIRLQQQLQQQHIPGSSSANAAGALPCPPRLLKLLSGLWDADPSRRPSAAEAVKTLSLLLRELRQQTQSGAAGASTLTADGPIASSSSLASSSFTTSASLPLRGIAGSACNKQSLVGTMATTRTSALAGAARRPWSRPGAALGGDCTQPIAAAADAARPCSAAADGFPQQA